MQLEVKVRAEGARNVEGEGSEGWQGTWNGTSAEGGCQGCVWLEMRVERGLAHSPRSKPKVLIGPRQGNPQVGPSPSQPTQILQTQERMERPGKEQVESIQWKG